MQSTTLTVVLIIEMIYAGAAPAIAVTSVKGYHTALDSTNTYNLGGDGGAFWVYSSTERTTVEYLNSTYNTTSGYDGGEPTISKCELPLLSYEQGHFMKTQEERDQVPLEDIFTGCYVIPGASTTFTLSKGSYFFWFLLPQTHFTMAWSSILGYTSLPGNTFTLLQASQSPETLAESCLANYLADVGSTPTPQSSDGASLFPDGSTVQTGYYFYYHFYDDENNVTLNNCPSTNVIQNPCYNTDDFSYSSSECRYAEAGYPSNSSPSVNECIGFLASLVVIYLAMAFYIGAVLPMGNGAALKFYFPLLPGYWRGGSGGRRDSAEDVEVGIEEGQVGVEAVNVEKTYGTVEALKPFSIKLNVGEVTSILGHNGAGTRLSCSLSILITVTTPHSYLFIYLLFSQGKSTFVNMLCCEENPSGGEILVFGESAVSQPHCVRSVLGECKQDDYLYPKVS
jgi:hypothetical protein